jgi:hypothetical protein
MPESDAAARPSVGTLEWERIGGPALSFGERLGVLASSAAVVSQSIFIRFWRRLAPGTPPAQVDLARWDPPDSGVAKEAERCLREASTPQMVNHSFRAYYFSAILYELSAAKQALDREGLYVAALMHDVCLAMPRPSTEHCFTVGCAREARRLMAAAGWNEERQNNVASAIVSNLNIRVPLGRFGAEAHYFPVGGMVEVLAQEWKVHPANIAEILGRYPRTGYLPDVLEHVAREAKLDPGGRFACLGPIFPWVVRRSAFSAER